VATSRLSDQAPAKKPMSVPSSPTDPLASWAERLAARVAPDEIDVALDVVAAYVEGGAARRGLFAGPRADPGAFGAGLPLVLPYVIDALAHCSSVVRAFLGEPAVSTAVATASLVVAIRQLRQGRKSEPPVNEAAHIGTPPATPEPAADSPVLDPVLVDLACLPHSGQGTL
jgi:hypothetical protein